MPLSLHQFHRLWRVLCDPHSAGASRLRKPLRLMNIIPLNTRLPSTQGLPWDFGKRVPAWPSACRLTCIDRSCHRSVFGAVNHAAQRKSMHP